MPRDYKHSAKKPRKPPPTPGWVWMLSGFIAGLGVALGVHLHHLAEPSETRPAPATAAVPASQAADDEQATGAAAQAADSNENTKEEYSFYEQLKKTVVQVPDDSDDNRPRRTPPPTTAPSIPTPGPSTPPPASPRPAQVATATTGTAKSGSYLVQTGSFRDATEAEAMRASLGLLGLSSTIQQAVDKQNRTWHRVQVPAPNDRELARVQSLLEREQIDMMIIARRD